MSYTVQAKAIKQFDLDPADTVTEVLQNVAVLLVTTVGSVPLARAQGVDTAAIDKPTAVAKATLTAAIHEAIETYEPRAEVVSVSYLDGEEPGQIIPIVEVDVKDG